MNNLPQQLLAKDKWIRLLFMLLFGFIGYMIRFVALVLVVLQFFTVLFTGISNPKLLQFGKLLSSYTYQILLFLTYNSEEKPYPFGPLPPV